MLCIFNGLYTSIMQDRSRLIDYSTTGNFCIDNCSYIHSNTASLAMHLVCGNQCDATQQYETLRRV